MLGIDYLLSPVTFRDFLDNNYDKTSIYIPGTSDKFNGLFGWDDLNHALNYGTLQPPQSRIIFEKKSLPPDELTKLDEWLKKGATFVINQLQTVDPLTEELTNALALDLNTRIQVNCYTSWPNKQGFDCHYDLHDVFIIQNEGRKLWRVYEPTFKHPVEQDRRQKGEMPEGRDPYIECEMTPGDVMYIPRGHWHKALSITPSIHFTVGLRPVTPLDFMQWLLDRWMIDDEEIFFRQNFPVAGAREFGGDVREMLASHIGEFGKWIANKAETTDFQELFPKFVMESVRPRLTYQLPHDAELQTAIDENTRFILARNQKTLAKYDPETRLARLVFFGSEFTMENVSPEFFDKAFSAEGTFSGSEIIAHCPEMTWDDLCPVLQVAFNQRIIRVA